MRHLLTESVLLFVIGGALGIALAYWSVPALLSLMPAGYLPFATVRIDRTVLGATLAVAVCTGLIFGLIPVALRTAGATPTAQWIIYGVLMILIVFFLPRGIVPAVSEWWRSKQPVRPERSDSGVEGRGVALSTAAPAPSPKRQALTRTPGSLSI